MFAAITYVFDHIHFHLASHHLTALSSPLVRLRSVDVLALSLFSFSFGLLLYMILLHVGHGIPMAGHSYWVVSILPEVPLFILSLGLLLSPSPSTWENAVTVALSDWPISLTIPHMS